MADIFLQKHMPIMLMCTNASSHMVDCWEFMGHIYLQSCLIILHELICIVGIYVPFEGHICCWYIYGNTIVNKCCSLLFFWGADLANGQLGICNQPAWSSLGLSLVPVYGTAGHIVDASEFI